MAASRRFVDVAAQLNRDIGGGKLRAQIVFDQPYAAIQHEELSFRHPVGGEAKYLTKALMSDYREVLQDLADHLFTIPVLSSMILAAESIAEGASALAPLEFNDLRRSSQVAIYSGNSKAYYRPPRIKRLSQGQMDRKDVLRAMGYGNW